MEFIISYFFCCNSPGNTFVLSPNNIISAQKRMPSILFFNLLSKNIKYFYFEVEGGKKQGDKKEPKDFNSSKGKRTDHQTGSKCRRLIIELFSATNNLYILHCQMDAFCSLSQCLHMYVEGRGCHSKFIF